MKSNHISYWVGYLKDGKRYLDGEWFWTPTRALARQQELDALYPKGLSCFAVAQRLDATEMQ